MYSVTILYVWSFDLYVWERNVESLLEILCCRLFGAKTLPKHDDVIKWKYFPRNWPFLREPVPGEFPAQRPVTRSFDVFFDLRLNKRLSKQPRGWWFETPAWSLWRHRNDQSFVSITTATEIRIFLNMSSNCLSSTKSCSKYIFCKLVTRFV